MHIAETIKEARERLGLTQEDLAEKLEVSRQAVSKWELGASVPSPENLRLLEAALEVRFPMEEAGPPQEAAAAEKTLRRWRLAALALGGLMVLALISIGMYMAVGLEEKPADAQVPEEPLITGISFFDENAAPLQPDLGDGWHSFTAGSKVLMVVEFQNGQENDINAVSLFLTPTGSETFDLRRQLAVQAAYDGRNFALFALDIPEDLMGHLDIQLECGGGRTITETLNVTALSS